MNKDETELMKIKEYLSMRINELSKAYQTEWLYEEDQKDAGDAIVNAFSQMYLDTRKRILKLDNKFEIEFYNLLHPYAEPHIPRKCYFSFLPSDLSKKKETSIPKSYSFYTVVLQEEVTFTLNEPLVLSDSVITNLFYADWKNKKIVRGYAKQETGAQSFTLWDYEKENLIVDSLEFSIKPIFEYDKNPEFELVFLNEKKEFIAIEENLLIGLSKADFRLIRKDYAYFLDSKLNLHGNFTLSIREGDFKADKDNKEENYRIICNLPADQNVDFSFFYAGILYSSLSHKTELIYGDEIGQITLNGDPVRIFPYMMDKTDCFYIGDDKAFSKKDADITLYIQMHYEVETIKPPKTDLPKYKLIMTYLPPEIPAEIKEVKPVSVRWEYFNGMAWKQIPESIHWSDCFDMEQYYVNGMDKSIYHTFRFRCPKDMNPCLLEDTFKHWIRIKLYRVSNPDAMYKTTYYPVITNIKTKFSYHGNEEIIDEVRTSNKIDEVIYPKEKIGLFRIHSILKITEEREILYLVFDKKPNPDFKLSFSMTDKNKNKTNAVVCLNGDYEEKDFLGVRGYFKALERYHMEEMAHKDLMVYETGLSFLNQKLQIDAIDYNCVLAENVRYKQLFAYIDKNQVPFTIKMEEVKVTAIQVYVKEQNEDQIKWMPWEVTNTMHDLSEKERIVHFDYQTGLLTFHKNAFLKFQPVFEEEALQIQYQLCNLLVELEEGTEFYPSDSNDLIRKIENISGFYSGSLMEEDRIIRKLKGSNRLISLRDMKEYIMIYYPSVERVECNYYASLKKLSIDIILDKKKNSLHLHDRWKELKDELKLQISGYVLLDLTVDGMEI